MAAEDPNPVFATSGLQLSPLEEFKVIEEKGGRDASDSGVSGSPRASICILSHKTIFYFYRKKKC